MSWLAPGPHHRWLEAEGDRLLAFSRASRHPRGGFAWLDDAGSPQLDRPVELWITCRMTHVLALGLLADEAPADGGPDRERLVDLVRHGVRSLRDALHDDRHGGWFAAVGREGPVDADKQAYGHAFVVLAASSAVTGRRSIVVSVMARW